MTIMVTGAAGYIGSHMVRVLQKAALPVVVVDNLSTGHRDAVPAGVPFLEADVADRSVVSSFMRKHGVRVIFHFASRIQVGESVTAPRLYYRDNLAAAIHLVEAALDEGVETFILSSTAAVYGAPRQAPIDESHPTCPINPYGETKLAIERMLMSYSRAYPLRYAGLRYFNAAGSDWEAGLGERHDPETHLIPRVLDVALGREPALTVFGRDYDTPDGTCVRDYVHVVDLCEAHLAALRYLSSGGQSGSLNLGSGVGHSVAAIVEKAREITRRPIETVEGPRREGDPPGACQ